MYKIFIPILLCLYFTTLCLPLAAQEIPGFRTFIAKPQKMTGEATLGILTKQQQRQRFLDRTTRVRSHMRPVPLKESTKPFASSKQFSASKIGSKTAEAQLSNKMIIRQQVSVTGSAKIDYYSASDISEPSVATRGKEVLVTGNWYSTFSTDGGITFKKLDPYASFGAPKIGGGFCCDQIALFDHQTDTMLWLMQGAMNAEGNTLRLAYATGESDIRTQNWTVLDLPSPDVLGKTGYWMDFPDMSLSNGHVMITTNVFSTAKEQRFSGSTVIRLNKEQLAKKATDLSISVQRFEEGSLKLTQGASSIQYWVAHESSSQAKIWGWSDEKQTPSYAATVDLERWEAPSVLNTANAAGPKSEKWLTRADGRINAAWQSDDKVGFAWTAGADNRFKYAHIRVALANVSDIAKAQIGEAITPVSEPHIWSDKFAMAYLAAAPNSLGQIGLILSYGGPNNFPSYAIGVFESPWNNPPTLTHGRSSLSGPLCPVKADPTDCGQWGDYFSVRPHGTNPTTWVTVGYTLQNTNSPVQALKAEAEFIWFGKP